MPFPTATILKPTMHGPPVMGAGMPTVLIGNMPAWRVGDMHTCPIPNVAPPFAPHVGGPTMPPGCVTVMVGGPPLTSMTDMIMEAAAIAPPTPNLIMMGVPTVLSP